MNTSQGIVDVVTSRPAGNGTAYNFKLADGTWYGLGFKKPAFDKGAFIKFSWEAKGNFKNADFNSVEILEEGAAVASPAPAATRTASKKPAVDWDGKDKRITLLACRKDAIALTKVAVDTGAIKLGAKNKLGVLSASVDTIAADLYFSIYGEKYPLFSVEETVEVANDDEE